MSKFYKENDSSWNICGMTYPSATCKLSWIDIDDMIVTSIYDSKNVVYKGNVSGLSRKDGAAYIDKDDFINSTVEFFIKPVGGGGSSGVSSVNNRTGAVVLDKNDVGLNNVENLSITSEISKIPIATQISNGLMSAEDKKKLDTGGAGSGVTSINGRKGDVTLSSSDVGLEKCNNTSDSEKPISELQRKRFKGIGRASLDGFSETPEEMRLKIPESDRIIGFMLTRSENSKPFTEIYNDSMTMDKNWSDSNNWSTVFTNEDKNKVNGYAGIDAKKRIAQSSMNTQFRNFDGYDFGLGFDPQAKLMAKSHISFNNAGFSLQYYISIKPDGNDAYIFDSRDPSSRNIDGYVIYKDSLENLYIKIGYNNDYFKVLIKTITQEENLHIVVVRELGKIKIYLNGSFIKEENEPIPGMYIGPSSTGIRIGSNNRYDPYQHYMGKIYLIRVFNRPLSKEDVLYYDNKGKPTLQPLLYEDIILDSTNKVYNGGNYDSGLIGNLNNVGRAEVSYELNTVNPIRVGQFTKQDGRIVCTKLGEGPVGYNLFTLNIAPPLLSFNKYITVSSRIKINSGKCVISSSGNEIELNGNSFGFTKLCNDYRAEFGIQFSSDNLFDIQLNGINVSQAGCVMEFLGENAYPDYWVESQSGLDAAMIDFGTNSAKPALIVKQPQTPITDTQIVDNVTNNIAVGTFNREYTLPAGYVVENICIKSTVSLTEIKLINVTLNYPLIESQVVNSGDTKYIPISVAQRISSADSTIRLNATGNTGSGFNIIINIKKCI